jgi:hypothetical protein
LIDGAESVVGQLFRFQVKADPIDLPEWNIVAMFLHCDDSPRFSPMSP